jgi:magnesium-transporting ATPase (P-type)
LVTYRDLSRKEFDTLKKQHNNFQKDSDKECLEENLTAVGIFGLQAPLRPGIVESIQVCKGAGITVIMCTGDNIDTAVAISKEAGIVTEDAAKEKFACMTGKDFREEVGEIQSVPGEDGKMRDCVGDVHKFEKVKGRLRVLARSSPADKFLLVTGLQECQGVVAVTGDGTNDAPALTKADVGFSMGITGTDVAQSASDIVLLDDNFSSIVVALKYGRNVYDNVRKFLQFQLSVNVVAMFIVFFGSVILKDSPLNAVQMLWVNLIMDTLGALALATEPPQESVLTRPPYDKDNAIVTEVMWRNVFGHAIYQAIVLMVIIFCGPGWLCKDYWTRCLDEGAGGDVCASWNPYYTTVVYENSDTLAWWQDKGLTNDDFDQGLLKDMTCEHYLANLAPGEDAGACDAVWNDPARRYSPMVFEEFEET